VATENLDETYAHDDIHDCYVADQEDPEPISADADVINYDQIPKHGFVACEGQLLKLANLRAITDCSTDGCGEAVSIQVTANGTAVELKWVRSCML
jgi:hypothetical protein